jgi:tRNA pseudouridine55 synthase
VNGALLVDKPSGPTSHDVVAFVRRLLKTKRVGHTGTLDPLATGLLVMLVGHATRLSQFLVADEKEYIADVRLGIATPTYDSLSLADPRTEVRSPTSVSVQQIEAILPDFLGTFPQLPPAYSAKKIDGTRAYDLARRQEPVELKPVQVTVRELQVLPVAQVEPATPDLGPRTSDLGRDPSLLRLRVVASAGFYVRSLAHDIGQVLGCGGHLEALRRTRVGRFRIEDAATLDVLEAQGPRAVERLISLNELLADLPAVRLTAEGLRRAGNGNALAPEHLQGGFRPRVDTGGEDLGAGDRVRLLDDAGEVLSVAEPRRDGLLHPLLVLR